MNKPLFKLEPRFAIAPTSILVKKCAPLISEDFSALELRSLAGVDEYAEMFSMYISAQTSLKQVAKTQMKETTMIDKTIPFQQVSYIYGNNVADCSDADLIAALKRITAGIKDLQDIAVLGADKYAEGRIKTLEDQKEQVLALLEKR